jgi:hypothetical protein
MTHESSPQIGKHTSPILWPIFSTDHQWSRHQFRKMCFAAPTLEIMGHTISVAGLAPTAEHTAAIDAYPSPLRISNNCNVSLAWWTFTTVFFQAAPSLETLHWSPEGQNKTLEWTAAVEEAFQSAKCLLAVVVPLQHPATNTELSLATDTSDSHIGGNMQQ